MTKVAETPLHLMAVRSPLSTCLTDLGRRALATPKTKPNHARVYVFLSEYRVELEHSTGATPVRPRAAGLLPRIAPSRLAIGSMKGDRHAIPAINS